MGGRITADDRGPLINIATWICMVMMIFAVGVKVVSKYAMVRKLQRDDYWMLATGIATLGQCIAASYQVAGGLGQHILTLSPALIDEFEKATYAASVLYIVSICLARQAVLQFLVTLARGGTRRQTVNAVVIFNAAWSTIATIAVLFECGVPHPWATINGKCFDKKIFWTVFGVLDVCLDLAIVILPVYLLHDLQISRSKKVWTMSAFAGRLFLLPFVILRISYLSTTTTDDRTWDTFHYVLISEIHVNISVITACVPFLKPFMDSLQSGILTMDLATVAPGHSGGRSRGRTGYALNSLGKAGLTSGTSQSQPGSNNRVSAIIHVEHDAHASADNEQQPHRGRGSRMAAFAKGQGWTRSSSGKNRQGNEATCTANGKDLDGAIGEDDVELQTRAGSEERMIIKKTTSVRITTTQMEPVDDARRSKESFEEGTNFRTPQNVDRKDDRKNGGL